jgi:hypothetical protein
MNKQEHHAIATQAYSLWEQEGCPHGRAMDHWLTAEHQVLSATDRPAGPAAPKTKKKATASKPRARRKASANKA